MAELDKPLVLNAARNPDANVIEKPDNTDQVTTAGPSDSGPEPQRGVPLSEPEPIPEPSVTTTQNTGERAPIDEVLAEASAQRAVDTGAVSGADDQGGVFYTSHPIQSLNVGGFQFENASLRLEGDQVGEFQELLDKMPLVERSRIRKLDMARVDSIVESRRNATKDFDSSVGRRALEALHATTPTIGIQDIAHAANPQTDHNVPQVPTTPVDPEGETGLDLGSHVAEEGAPNQIG
jgi:hypothetical protein